MSKYEEQFQKETQQTLGCTNEYIDWLEQRLEKAEEKIKNYKDTLDKIRTGKF